MAANGGEEEPVPGDCRYQADIPLDRYLVKI